MTDISRQIWDMKYRLKAPDGTPLEKDVAESWLRVALAASHAERPEQRREWAQKFAEALAGHRFLPAGRILAGAGTDRNVTLFNCFVMGRIEDSMDGIFSHLREAALTLQQGGGIGYDFSSLRPKGAPVAGVGADASGPVSFMDVWDSMCRTIMSAGSRRGAMMATLSCDHPDIELFIDAKQQSGRLSMFNLSVLATDAFMDAVKQDANWDLKFDGKIYKTIRARELWDRIMRATYDAAEPGVIFIDRINRENNLSYCETISATNPCLTADSWIQTSEGPRQIAELVGRPFTAIADGRLWASDERGFFSQGTKQTVHLRTREGYALRGTPDHLIRKIVRRTRWSCEWEWAQMGSLSTGDEILLHNHRSRPSWGAADGRDDAEGYLLGLLVGDGTLKSDKAILCAWPGQKTVNGAGERPGIRGVMEAAEAAARTLPHRSDFSGWIEVPGRGEYRLALGALKQLAHDMGLSPGNKTVTAAMERRSSAFCTAFLRGLFDADGSVQGQQVKGVSVRLAQSDLAVLKTAQRMLLRLGVVSTIYEQRRPEGFKLLPDGKGGRKTYAVREQHELVISGDNLFVYRDRIGFGDTAKLSALNNLLAGYKRAPNRESFCATVDAIEEAEEAEVFDAAIPGLNAFDANGLWAHNCGEQPLPPYGACLLGSINLAKLVKNPFEDDASLDEDELARLTRTAVRMLDNVIDVSRFPLEAQRAEAMAKRRIGLGVTGLADALIFCRVRYGSKESLALIDRWLSVLSHAAYDASADIAAEKGAFPLFDREEFLARPFVQRLPQAIRDKIAANGIRNGLLTSIAPTGTISLFADNVSSGIEPVFAYSFTRHVLQADGTRREEKVSDYAWRAFRARFGEDASLPDYFVSAQELIPDDHLAVQAVAQKHIDSSISKTINVPQSISFEAFKDVYLKAYETGCKGCTTYRPNVITGAVLEAAPEPQQIETDQPSLPLSLPRATGDVVYMTRPLDRPELLTGQTYKIKWQDSDHAFYITINDIEQDGRKRPFEIFINSKNMEAYAWTLALTRMVSAVFRRGGDVSFVVDELKAVFDPRGGQWMGGRYVPSLLAAIGEVIERHLVATGFMTPRETPIPREERRAVALAAEGAPARYCPRCSSPSFVKIEGCDTCVACGYSRCG